MSTLLCRCLGHCTDGQYESSDILLVLMPHKNSHGTVRIIQELEQSWKAQSTQSEHIADVAALGHGKHTYRR